MYGIERRNITVDDGSEDGLDVEEKRFPYYNDNLDRIGYTSRFTDDKGKCFSFIEFAEGDEEGRIRYCPHCEKYGFQYLLGAKIKKKDEPPAPDDDQWLSCYQCGNTYAIHETFTESKIKDSVETTDNPHDNNQSIFMSTSSRARQRRKRKANQA